MHKTYAQVCGFAALFFLSLFFFFFCSLSVLPPDLLFPRVATQEFMAAPCLLSGGNLQALPTNFGGPARAPRPARLQQSPARAAPQGCRSPRLAPSLPERIPHPPCGTAGGAAGRGDTPLPGSGTPGVGSQPGRAPAGPRCRCRALACSAVRSSPVGWGGAAGAARAPRAENVVPRSRV